MKQLGSVYARAHRLRDRKGEELSEFPEDLIIREFPVPERMPGWSDTSRIAQGKML